jgi:hypothetical protein
MKKNYFLSLAFLLFFSFTLSAQINKGSLLLGGDIGFSTQKTTSNRAKTSTQNGFTISPSFGKAIKTNTFFGGFVLIRSYREKNDPTNYYFDHKINGWGAGIYLRKYYPLGKSPFSVYIQGTFDYDYNKEYGNGGPYNVFTTKTNSLNLYCNPGISFKISKKLQLETGMDQLLSLSYFHQQYDFLGTDVLHNTTNGFSLNSSISNLSGLYLGFRLLINK